MYILISIFAFYAMGIISYEYGFFGYLFTAVLVMLIYNSFITKRYIYNLVIIAFLILSFLNCNYNSTFILKQYINEEADFVVKINSQNKINPNSTYISYNGKVIGINNALLKEEENTIIYINKEHSIKENSIVELKGNVGDSSFNKNKMLFNYDNYLRSKKIGAVIFANESIITIEENYSFLNEVSRKFRNYTENTFYNSLNKENADIMLSIILGDIDYLDENLYDNIKVMGLAHVFAVSGSHIVLMYGFMLNFLRLCFLTRRVSWVITWALIWFYGFLIGFPLAVLRSLVMFTLLFGAEVFYRKYNSLNSIGLAALVLTIYNTYWIFDAGFLLSFSAALSLIIYNKYIMKHITKFSIALNTIYLYLFLQIFTLPVIAYYFNYLPFMGIIYNILLLPIFTVILIYGFILLILNFSFSSLLIIPFKIFNYILFSLRYILNFTENFAFNGITVPTMSIGLIIFFYITFFFMVYLYNHNNIQIKKCVFTVLISFCSINFFLISLLDNSLYFNVADARQGLFTTIKYKNTNLIIDCGSNSSNFGEYTVVPYMTKRGVTNIDGVFISHWDADHYSGLNGLLNSHIIVKRIFSSSYNNEIDIVVLKKGNNLKLDENLKIEILWPDINYTSHTTNNNSLVILLTFKDKKIMLPGDIENEAESLLLNDINYVDILIVPHHGSKTSSTEGFVKKSDPKIAVLSYGKNNYGIPSEEVISRYENEGSLILSTFNEGEINFILKNGKIYYNTYTGIKSDNYYELYIEEFVFNLINFCLLLYWMAGKGEKHEL